MVRSRFKVLTAQKQLAQGQPLTLRDIAASSGVSYMAVQKLNSGRGSRVDYETLDRLCKYFGCGVGDLLEYVEDAPQVLEGDAE